MPIKFKCGSCQHVLTVPDNLAGKQGKCPKCQTALRVPVPKAAASQGSGQPVAAAPAPYVDPRMNSLLNEVGVVQKTGPVCPSCSADIKPGVVVCVNCGMNLQTGQKITGFDAKVERPEFDNEHLNLAVTNMHRDAQIQTRRDRAQMPWWVLASYLIGAIVLCGAGVVIVDGVWGSKSDPSTLMGKLQALPVLVVLGCTVGITGCALCLFAHLSICIYGLEQSWSKAALCFFLPLIYSMPYGIMNWTNNKAPVKGLGMGLSFLGVGIGLILAGGGFGKLNGLF
jgi:hypothetical protein